MSLERLVDPERKIKCPICHRRFKSMIGLRQHFKRSHSNQGNCPVCGEKYRDLTAHYRHAVRMYGDIHHKALHVLTAKVFIRVPEEWVNETIEYLTVKD